MGKGKQRVATLGAEVLTWDGEWGMGMEWAMVSQNMGDTKQGLKVLTIL